MKFILKCLTFLLIVFIIGLGFVFWQGKLFLDTPMQTPGKEVYFDVEPGTSFAKMAQNLEKQGIISDSFKFSLLARFRKLDNKLQAGRFKLHTNWLPETILQELMLGKAILHRITIREGLTWWQTGKLLEKHGFVRFDDFKKVITDKEFLRHYGIPFDTAEGFLMPDTYLLKKEDVLTEKGARSIAGRLVDTFWQKMQPYWPNQTKPNLEELIKIVTLASIVEKETSVPSERARVAGVYTNRLNINMILQADPTIIYGLGPSFDGNLRRKHINDAANIYNTYQHAGLPPGPICSAGVAALRAALKPEQHEYFYFVAITDGGAHAFSKTLAEHNRAVREYLRNRKKKN